MIDLRLWKIALLTIPLAAVIAMFSLQGVPSSLSPGIPPDAFDPDTATPLAKQLATAAPYPTPGSSADNALAEQVKSRFAAIDGATVSEQSFDSSFHGHDVHLRNLIATLPGESNRQIALIAPRDVAEGSGAVTSAAATAALLEIADGFSGTSHHKTLVFVSTDGSSIGALGARRFVHDYTDSGLLDAAIVLSQPAVTHPTAPLVIPWSIGAQSTASQLADTANATVSKETATPAGDEGPLSDLFRLALPAGLGEQGPLIQAGLPAVRLSSDGELPIDPSQDTPENFNPDTYDRLGRAALSLILALDGSPGAVEHGPNTYIGLAGNLLPGWTIAMLALALLAPVALAAGSGLVASARSPIEAVHGAVWSALRALPFLGALMLLGAATLVGLMPSPDFPFDPRLRIAGGRRHDLRGAGGPRLLRDRLLPSATPIPAGPCQRHRRSGGALARLHRRARPLAREPVPRAARGPGRAGLAARRGARYLGAPRSGRSRAARPAALRRADRQPGEPPRRRGERLARPAADARRRADRRADRAARLPAGRVRRGDRRGGRPRARSSRPRDDARRRQRDLRAQASARDGAAGAAPAGGGARARSAGAGEGPAPLVEAARLELPAAGQGEPDAPALGDVADLGEPRPRFGDG